MNKVVSTLLVAIIIGFVEMRITVGQLAVQVASIAKKVEVIDFVKDEQINRKDVIDWVREFRQNNGWATRPYPHTHNRSENDEPN